MGRLSTSLSLVLGLLADGKPRSYRDVVRATCLSEGAATNALRRGWERGAILRTKAPIYESEKIFKGRSGFSRNLRPFHLYVLKPEGLDRLSLDGCEFVGYSKRYLDARGGAGESKSKLVLDFLQRNKDRALFSKELAEALKDKNVKIQDIMSNVRRFERKGLVYVRGYRTDEGQTPFKDGYLLTYIDQDKPREQALEEAIQRTNLVLDKRSSTNPVIQRVHLIKDTIFESSKLRDLASFSFIKDKLGCSEYEAETAIARALQLYPELREIKLFGAYKYYYHSSMPSEDLKAAIRLKENFVRKTKGRDNRVGHNWEAVPEWFIDRFTTGAKFWTQNHRTGGMDPRRITIHLIKPVNGRRNNAEVDRVWEVTPGVFAEPITYVLSCKWGLVNKDHLDDFLEVLRWSKEFGVDTPEGRQVKQGIIGIFAASAFNPNDKVKLKDGATISLASYAKRMNIQLLKASDFNEKLHQRGCPREVTVQKICRIAKNEREVREILEAIWENTERSEEILSKVAEDNKDLYEFEKKLNEAKDQ